MKNWFAFFPLLSLIGTICGGNGEYSINTTIIAMNIYFFTISSAFLCFPEYIIEYVYKKTCDVMHTFLIRVISFMNIFLNVLFWLMTYEVKFKSASFLWTFYSGAFFLSQKNMDVTIPIALNIFLLNIGTVIIFVSCLV